MIRRIARAFANLFGRRRLDEDLDAEVGAYEDQLAAEKERAGLPEGAARRAAHIEMGGHDAVKDAVRDVRAGASLELLLRDLKHALRSLVRSPSFTVFTVLTFALAIGGMTVIFTLVNAVFLRPLPYRDSDRLVMVLEADSGNPSGGYNVAAPNYLDWQRQSDVFQGMALFEFQGFNLSGEGEPEQAYGLRTTSGLFNVLGVAPILGRLLQPSDDSGTGNRVVVLGNQIWRRRYNGDSSIVGKTIRLNQGSWTVVGVLPETFGFPRVWQQVYVPIALNAEDQHRGSHSFFAVARLKDGVSVAAARQQMRAIGDRLASEYPASNAGETANAFPMKELWVQSSAETLRALMAAVGLVLLIAAANVAGLMVARGNARRREIATRLALGGTRARVVREMVTESVLLALAGAVLGFVLAVFGLRQLMTVLPQGMRNVPFRELSSLAPDARVFGFSVIVALLAGILSGLPSALSVIPGELSGVLRDGAVHGATAHRGHRLRGLLVGFEVALAVVVLVSAGLLIASIGRLHRVAPGLDPHNVMALGVSLPQTDFYGPAVRTSFCADVAREVGSLPGVTAVGAVSQLPLSGSTAGRGFVVEGAAPPAAGQEPGAWWGIACPGYFQAMGIRLVSGRDFTMDDRATSPMVVVINETLRDRYFPGKDPVGQRIRLGGQDSNAPWMTIVGMIADVKHSGLRDDKHPYLYATYQQNAWPAMSVIVRTAGDPRAMERAVRETLMRAEPEQPVGHADLMETVLENSLGFLRFPMLLFSLFGLMAALLAALGVFGVAAQAVLQRKRELGIRLALGARASQVCALVVRQVMRPVVIGVAAGVLAAAAGTRVLANLLYDIKPGDPRMIVLGSLALAAVALIACLLPALRATRVDPAMVLRED
jgi:putative ABC transport system permease protein